MSMQDYTMVRRNLLLKTVSEHLKAQNSRSVSLAGMSCKYRGKDGKKCAVGALIHDDHYSADLEGILLFPDLGDYDDIQCMDAGKALHAALVASGVHQEDFPLLEEFQHAHDFAGTSSDTFWSTCRPALVNIAKNYHLDVGLIPA